MKRFIELRQILRGEPAGGTAPACLAVGEIRHVTKPGPLSGPSLVTMKSGETFLVEESIVTITAMIEAE